jgi:hypothetical protein
MELKKVNAGNLRAIGYDERARLLQVETTAGVFQYAGVTPEIYRRLASSGSMWSYFRDNIEEEFPSKRLR